MHSHRIISLHLGGPRSLRPSVPGPDSPPPPPPERTLSCRPTVPVLTAPAGQCAAWTLEHHKTSSSKNQQVTRIPGIWTAYWLDQADQDNKHQIKKTSMDNVLGVSLKLESVEYPFDNL